MKKLDGLCVLNTRPQAQGQNLSNQIQQEGGSVLSCPALEIVASDNNWINNLPLLSEVKQAIFISVNAVEYFFRTIQDKKLNWPCSIVTLPIGLGTAKTLEQFGVFPHTIPMISDSEHLLNLNSLQSVHNQSILLVKGEGGRTIIAKTLKKRGAKLKQLSVYKRIIPWINQDSYQRMWRNQHVDIILFTSHEGMINLFSLLGEEERGRLSQTPCLVISERLAKAARQMGLIKVLTCQPETIMNALIEFRQGL
jgi:uroporphyrinogen-III synthase